jgi:hypothetical protein
MYSFYGNFFDLTNLTSWTSNFYLIPSNYPNANSNNDKKI